MNNEKSTITYAIPYFDETGQMRAPYQLCKGFLDTGWSVFIETLNLEQNSNINFAWEKVPIKKVNGVNKKHKMLNFVINFFRRREREIVISWLCFVLSLSLLLGALL